MGLDHCLRTAKQNGERSRQLKHPETRTWYPNWCHPCAHNPRYSDSNTIITTTYFDVQDLWKNGIPSKLVSRKPTCGPFGHSSAHLVIKRGETTNCGWTSTKPPKSCSVLVDDDHIIISPCSSVSISIPGHSVCNHENGIPSRQTNTHLEDQLMVGSSC